MRKNKKERMALIIAVLILICAAVLLYAFLSKSIKNADTDSKDNSLSLTEETIENIVHSHDEEDCYTGVGGRSDIEAELDYMILKYSSGREDLKRKDSDSDDDTRKDENDNSTVKDDSGDDDSVKNYDDWREAIYEAYRDIDSSVEFTTASDITEEDVVEAINIDCRYRTGEDGIFMDWYSYNITEKGDNLQWRIGLGYSRDRDEIIRIKNDTTDKENIEAGRLDFKSLSDEEKIKLINEYVCDSVEYYPSQPYPDQSHTAYGALFESVAVCDGYSRLVKMLCDDMEIECRIVCGEVINAGGHAWNLVKVDNQWYHLDTTWNDGSADKYSYYLIPDSYLEGTRIWNKNMYPKAATAPYNR